MTATESLKATAALYAAIAEAVDKASKAGLEKDFIQAILEKATEQVGEADE